MAKSDGAIFRVEEIDGEKYRVMYFKNNKGGYTRSKFPKKIKPKKRGRPTKATRVTENRKLIAENRRAIVNNAKSINNKRTNASKPQTTRTRTHPHMHKAVTPKSKFRTPNENKYVRRAQNTNNLIDKWKKLAER